MKLRYHLLCAFCINTLIVFAQESSIAERLGHPLDAKMLIIHADDLGVTHSENMASIKGLEESPVNSASIMVPCPWFPEIADYAQKNKMMDLGLHLTLNSEWKNYKWGPVTSEDSVAGLVNDKGYFYASVDSVCILASPNQVALELRNQVKKAYQFGIDVTHLDAHMGAAMSTLEFLEAYIKVGQEFSLPVLLDNRLPAMENERIQKLLTTRDVIVDHTYSVGPLEYKEGMAKYYTNIFENLEPGLNCLLIHLAYNDAEMQGVTIDHPDWGAAWRQADFDFFMSPECAQLLKRENIIWVVGRQVRVRVIFYFQYKPCLRSSRRSS